MSDLGLVLSGGGARGAYQVGVIKYLAERGIEPDVYAGASVGALNAAFLAAAPSLKVGAARLEDIWTSLSNEQMIKINPNLIDLGLLFSGFKQILSVRELERILSKMMLAPPVLNDLMMLLESPLFLELEKGILDNGALKSLVEDHLNLDNLDTGKPLWISLYESQGALLDLLEYTGACIGLKENRSSEYIQLQMLSNEDKVKALLATAALPLVFESQPLQGKLYRDGGLGEARTNKGNTPLKPLADTGCKKAIVVHLGHGSLWDRNDYKETSIIEIRPKEDIHSEGRLKSLINFSTEKINELIRLGYQDAKRNIENVVHAAGLQSYSEKTRHKMNESMKKLKSDSLDDLLSKL